VIILRWSVNIKHDSKQDVAITAAFSTALLDHEFKFLTDLGSYRYLVCGWESILITLTIIIAWHKCTKCSSQTQKLSWWGHPQMSIYPVRDGLQFIASYKFSAVYLVGIIYTSFTKYVTCMTHYIPGMLPHCFRVNCSSHVILQISEPFTDPWGSPLVISRPTVT